MTEPPAGFDSCKAIGHRGPEWSRTIVLPGGASVPQGEASLPLFNSSHIKVIDFKSTGTYVYNNACEYIVYAPERVRIRYLVQVK